MIPLLTSLFALAAEGPLVTAVSVAPDVRADDRGLRAETPQLLLHLKDGGTELPCVWLERADACMVAEPPRKYRGSDLRWDPALTGTWPEIRFVMDFDGSFSEWSSPFTTQDVGLSAYLAGGRAHRALIESDLRSGRTWSTPVPYVLHLSPAGRWRAAADLHDRVASDLPGQIADAWRCSAAGRAQTGVALAAGTLPATQAWLAQAEVSCPGANLPAVRARLCAVWFDQQRSEAEAWCGADQWRSSDLPPGEFASDVVWRHRSPPSFPDKAKGRHFPEQACIATVWFSEAGKAGRVDVEGCAEPFHDETRNVLLRWTTQPRLADGAAVPFYTVVSVRYKEF